MAVGVRIIAMTSTPSDFRFLFPLYGRRAGVRLALGLHPLEADRVNVRQELALFREYAQHTSYIGEVGLDLSREGKPSRSIQEAVLDAMLAIPGIPDKVISVHSRNASAETVRRFREAGARRTIFHWYSGRLRDLDEALQAGFYFSVNPAMTRSEKGRRVIARLPRERVLLESDGPYARVNGRPTEPRDVLPVRDYIARLWETSPHEADEELDRNLRRLCAGLSLNSPD